MNTGRFLTFLQVLLAKEKEFEVQTVLSDVLNAIRQLTDQPQNSDLQTALSQSLARLDGVTTSVTSSFTPAQYDLLSSVEGGEMLGPALGKWIKEWVATNGMTPAVARDQIAALTKRRAKLISTITETVERLTSLGVAPEEPPISPVELGFLIPRELFNSDFDQFRKELTFLSQTMRFYSEAVTGGAEEITIGEISASDPLLFLGVSVSTVLALSASIKWLLDAVKSTLEIRELMARSKEAKLSNRIIDGFTAEIDEVLQAAVRDRVDQLMKNVPDKPRRHEIREGLEMATTGLLARIERGMKVEIKIGQVAAVPENAASAREASLFAQVEVISQQLIFPRITGEPLISLPAEATSGVANDV